MKSAIIIHGSPEEKEFRDPSTPSPSNFQWLPWLQKQFTLKGVDAQTPEMPKPYDPIYQEWKQVFERFQPDENTTLIGHSCGGGFLVRWLSENKVKVGRVILVAPWLDPGGELTTDFFKFEIDPSFPSRTEKTVIMCSTDDHIDMIKTLATLEEKLVGAEYREFTDKQHFCTPTLPEILLELQ